MGKQCLSTLHPEPSAPRAEARTKNNRKCCREHAHPVSLVLGRDGAGLRGSGVQIEL